MKPLIAVMALGTLSLFGQAGAPSFEVASVKKNTTSEKPTIDAKGDQLRIVNVPLRFIVALGWQVPNDRVSGASWTDIDGYDIVAKLPADFTRDKFGPMLQNLLTERFGLQIHRDQTPVLVYALVLGKGQPSLRAASPGERRTSTCEPKERPKLTCNFQNTTAAQFAESLPHLLPKNWFDAPVMDRTGLTGAYDFTLTFTMTDRPPESDAVAPEPAAPGAPYLLDAIQEQLGLRVERRKIPLDRIVIDHAERTPVAN